MGKKSPPPKPPDLTPISNAQMQIAAQANELAREQLGLSREQYEFMRANAAEELALAREQADRTFGLQQAAFDSGERAAEFSRQVGQTQIDAMNQQMGFAAEDRQRYEDVFLPMQDRYIDEANAYDTPERREAEASRQMVDVQRQTEAQRANADARLRSMGVDPSEVRSTAMVNQMGTATAANQALAGNMGRQNIEDRGRSMRESAINLGNGLPAQSMAGYGGATNSGNSAVNAGTANQGAQLGALGAGVNMGSTALGYRSGALGNYGALVGSPTQWASIGQNSMGMAGNQYNNAASTMSQGFNNSMASWNAGQQQAQQNFSNIAGLASIGAGAFMAEGGAIETNNAPDNPTKVGAIDMSMAKKIKKNKPTWRDDPKMKQRAESAFAAARSYLAPSSEPYNPGQPSEMAVRPIYFAEGGSRAIPRRQSRDQIHAMLTEGEYVVPADVVNALGINHFDKLVAKYHRSGA